MTDDLVGRLEAWADNDAEYGHHARSSDWLAAKARIEALEGENRKLREAAAPFLDLGPQTGAWGVISKKLTGMAPLTLTVTKDQFKALWALAKDKSDG